MLARLRRGRLSDDLFVAPILQQVALDVLTAPGWPRHLAGVRRVLRERRDALVLAIRERLPDGRLDLIPAGGLHLWLRLPERCSDAEVAGRGRARGDGDGGPGQLPRRAAPVLPAAQLRRRGAPRAAPRHRDPGRRHRAGSSYLVDQLDELDFSAQAGSLRRTD